MASDRPGFRPDIEGLRGLAILLVVGFHAGVSWLAGGYVGVDVFFVLSGYFITGLLAREVATSGDVDLSEFFARRARRLLPAFFVVLAATLALALWLYAPIDQPDVAFDARAVAVHAGNLLFAANAVHYHARSNNPLLHTWSLAVEQQFYVIWPMMFALLGRLHGEGGVTKRRILAWIGVAGALSFIASLWVTRSAQAWAFFGMPTRIWEFAAGGAAAVALDSTSRAGTRLARSATALQVGGLLAIGVATLTVNGATPYPGVAALLPVLGAVALLVGGRPSASEDVNASSANPTIVSRALGAAPLRWFGRLSYTWYLWHWPLVVLGGIVNWEIGVVGRLAWSLVALGLAVLTHRFVEEPIRRGTALDDRPHVFNLYVLGATVAAVLVATVALSLARVRASSPAQRPFAVARADAMSHDCWGSMLTDPTAPCIFGDTAARTTVVLLGDSHAEHWLPAVDRAGRAQHWKVYAMVKPACPVSDMPELVNAALKRSYVECTNWRRRMLARIVSMHPNAVILSSYDHYMPLTGDQSSWQVTPLAWKNGLRRTYGLLSRAGINTVVIRGTPVAGIDAPSCLSRRASGAPFAGKPCTYDRSRSLHPDAIAAQNEAVRGLPHIAFIDMGDRVCPTSARRCSVVQRGLIVFRDDDHLTATFSRSEAPVLGARVSAAVASLSRVR
ncbi:MAG TPA: acyltransferase family protein [Gemmatimonadaceae bacterium]|nr:acyltransferase family protein [Gemmatimonadaceae bacterium]